MKSVLIILMLMISFTNKADTYIGFAEGIHLNGEKINDSHPYIGFQYKDVGVITYINSFGKLGIAPYYELSTDNHVVNYRLKMGLTTGYSRRMTYKGSSYNLDRKFFFNNEIMLFVVPEVVITYEKIDLSLSVLGDSVNMGITWRF